MAALVLVLLLILAAPAGAATVSLGSTQICDEKLGCSEAPKLTFTAAPGELNDLRVRGENRSFTFADAGARITAGRGCEADGDHRAVCFAESSVALVSVDLGDGDDRADVAPIAVVRGGAGDDAISGGRGIGGDGNDTLSGPGLLEGGPGADRLVGSGSGGPGDDVIDASAGSGSGSLGPGRDVYIGSPGIDYVADDGGDDPSVDRIDGGAGGSDTVDYARTRGPVVVDLAGAGSSDELSGFEVVVGSPAADTLIGTDGADQIRGQDGDDRIDGRGGDDGLDGERGDDRIDAGPGHDRAFGGAGRDVIGLGDGDDDVFAEDDFVRDEVDCGPGRDSAGLDRDDGRSDCERLRLREPPNVVARAAPAGRGLHRLHYFTWCEDWISCRGTSHVAVRVGRRVLHLAPVRFGRRGSRGAPFSERFRMPRAAARALRRGDRLTLRVTSFLDPGEAAGVLPAEDRVRLSARARRASPDR